jgi:hypothetical protein
MTEILIGIVPMKKMNTLLLPCYCKQYSRENTSGLVVLSMPMVTEVCMVFLPIRDM